MGLGPVGLVSLGQARDLALAARKQLHAGTDPLSARQAERVQQQLQTAKSVTFDACVAAFLDSHRDGWKNPKHRQQWENTLKTYGSPVLGALPVHDIDVNLVMQAVEPLWRGKNETASRLRQRIERVLDWAKIKGYRTGDNPARWNGHLDQLLPARGKVRAVKHHTALPYAELPGFMPKLRKCEGIAARALEFVIVTAVRTGDVIGNNREDRPAMKWSHVDLNGRVWTIPKTKVDVEHTVPLSGPAIAVLRAMKALRLDDDVVFPSIDKPGKPLSNGAMLSLLDRMGPEFEKLTVHGFRSSFKTWASEQTAFERDVIEAALAHGISDKLEAAYRRGTFFEKRRRLMDAWGQFISGTASGSKIVALRRR